MWIWGTSCPEAGSLLIAQNEALFGLDLLCHEDHVVEYLIRAAFHVGVGLSGNYQTVALLDGVDVHDDKAQIVLIELCAGDLSVCDFGE